MATMRLPTQDRIFAIVGLLSAGALTSAAGGHLQSWLGLPWAETAVLLALVTAPFVCMHGILLVATTLAKWRVRPMVWLLGTSRAAMRALLHLAAGTTLAVGLSLGFAMGSDLVLAITTLLALGMSLAAEWTFSAKIGPLASLLREQERQMVRECDEP